MNAEELKIATSPNTK